MKKQRKVGSGRKSLYRNRAQVSMYMENSLKRKLQKEAKANGIALTTEIAARLAASFVGRK